jgi:Glyoxalase-like domain
MRTQVTFDAADPHALATFWANVLGTEVEDHSDFVDQLVADGRMPTADRITINGRSAFRDVAACRDPRGMEPRFFFQRFPKASSRRTGSTSTSMSTLTARLKRSPGSRPSVPSSLRLTTTAARSPMSCATPKATSSACTDLLSG